ncbi:flavoprotein [Brachybacterium avium]|uniref:Flavoprotein n=1 Tax=Brachybacterium avium TaxID=2017485 RepID=A0A220UC78_9MICO|nr:CE1759 family FMN reductase [Brachybacterium avium]ASK65620.1 flavoprotein [Brachybacterium avium]
MTSYRLLALTAGLSTPSSTRMLTDQLARESAAALGKDGAGVEVTTVELREYAHDITDALLTRFPGERLALVLEQIRAADAVIAVTPVFNVGPSGLFTMFFDAVDMELWRNKPLLLGATAGTARHSLAIDYAIRPMFGYLKSEVVPTAVFAASSDLGADTEGQADGTPLIARVRRAATELAVMLRAGLVDAPETGAAAESSGESGTTPAPTAGLDPEFADFVPMGTLLGHG